MNFNEFHWHDAIIRNIQIDRLNPGKEDSVVFEIEWPDEKGKATLVFEEVYWAMLNLNFGIIADETILNAMVLDEDNEDLNNFYSKWRGAMNEVKLSTYKISLNSTGGEIKVISKGFRVVEK